MGFGSGGGGGSESKEREGEGMGAGAYVGIEPIGFLVTKGDEIPFIEAGKAHGLSAAFEKVPELIEKLTITSPNSQKWLKVLAVFFQA